MLFSSSGLFYSNVHETIKMPEKTGFKKPKSDDFLPGKMKLEKKILL
jgi:hypothetical protein